MIVKFFSSHCPKCSVLETKLKRKNIDFELIDNIDEITEYGKSHGIMSAPILEVDGQTMDFKTANDWVNGVK